jgi:hypothetical protein
MDLHRLRPARDAGRLVLRFAGLPEVCEPAQVHCVHSRGLVKSNGIRATRKLKRLPGITIRVQSRRVFAYEVTDRGAERELLCKLISDRLSLS